MPRFKAFRIHDQEGTARLESLLLDDLSAGEVVIRACYSSVNYKDALAATGKGRILRRFPLVGGIDVAGVVEQSVDERFGPGDEVIVTGCGLGESHDGGFSEVVRVPADWVVPLPDGLALRDAMVLGTAGFTAALALDRMEQNGQSPVQGPVVVSGASGGVGSVAVDLLSGRGYEVIALSRKPDADGYLVSLGASRVLDTDTVERDDAPLEQAQWGGAVDCVGGNTLAWLTRTVRPWGNITSIGLAGGAQLNTTVMPFILRGVSLLGISSANCPMERRRKVWRRLVTDLRPHHLDRIIAGVIRLDELPVVFDRVLSGNHRGRFLVSMINH
jgi:acrylyl-CoA reductase (NADPH)